MAGRVRGRPGARRATRGRHGRATRGRLDRATRGRLDRATRGRDPVPRHPRGRAGGRRSMAPPSRALARGGGRARPRRRGLAGRRPCVGLGRRRRPGARRAWLLEGRHVVTHRARRPRRRRRHATAARRHPRRPKGRQELERVRPRRRRRDLGIVEHRGGNGGSLQHLFGPERPSSRSDRDVRGRVRQTNPRSGGERT